MKNRINWIMFFLLTMTALGLIPGTASAETTNEDFLRNFEGVYAWEKGLYQGAIDSANPYSKPLRILKTTESGINVLLDRVLVTEDELAVSFLISGDFPQDLIDVQMFADIDVGPLLPYPSHSFEAVRGEPEDRWPIRRILSEKNEDSGEPPVVLDTRTVLLIRHDGYISPTDPIRVRVRIPLITVTWLYPATDGTFREQRYFEDELLEFEFETDGAELAAQTKSFQLDHTFEIGGQPYEFHNFRFNPMQLILFTGPAWEYVEAGRGAYLTGIPYVEAAADDGTIIYLDPSDTYFRPYNGFTRKILKPEIIRALEQIKTLTLTPCYLPKPVIKDEKSYSYPRRGSAAFDCSSEWAVTLNIRD